MKHAATLRIHAKCHEPKVSWLELLENVLATKLLVASDVFISQQDGSWALIATGATFEAIQWQR
jgi:hypothetical protein